MRYFLLFLLISLAANAADYSGKFGLGGNVGYNWPIFGNPHNTAADGGETWGLHARYHFNTKWGVDVAYNRHEFDDISTAAQVFDAMALYRFGGADRTSLIAGLGAGVVDLSHYDPSNLKLGLKARVGVEHDIYKDCVSLGGYVDYQRVDKMLFGDNLPGRVIHTIAPRIALTFYFGGDKAHAEEPKKSAPMTSAAPVAVTDSDMDGVSDSLDKCPGTPRGTQVNLYGCAAEEKGTIKLDVHFASGSAAVPAQYQSEIQAVADFMKTHAQTQVVIEGHTDSSGSAALNKSLSQKRADAVKADLINKYGVAANRLSAVGYGPEKPVAPNTSADGRAQNRRVIAVISE